jgi:hypothetical protein
VEKKNAFEQILVSLLPWARHPNASALTVCPWRTAQGSTILVAVVAVAALVMVFLVIVVVAIVVATTIAVVVWAIIVVVAVVLVVAVILAVRFEEVVRAIMVMVVIVVITLVLVFVLPHRNYLLGGRRHRGLVVTAYRQATRTLPDLQKHRFWKILDQQSNWSSAVHASGNRGMNNASSACRTASLASVTLDEHCNMVRKYKVRERKPARNTWLVYFVDMRWMTLANKNGVGKATLKNNSLMMRVVEMVWKNAWKLGWKLAWKVVWKVVWKGGVKSGVKCGVNNAVKNGVKSCVKKRWKNPRMFRGQNCIKTLFEMRAFFPHQNPRHFPRQRFSRFEPANSTLFENTPQQMCQHGVQTFGLATLELWKNVQ